MDEMKCDMMIKAPLTMMKEKYRNLIFKIWIGFFKIAVYVFYVKKMCPYLRPMPIF